MRIVNNASITSKNDVRMRTDLRSVQTTGIKVKLENGKWYYDWQMGLYGPIFGYNPDWWVGALQRGIRDSVANSIAHENEIIAGELLQEFYPDIEGVRFMLNGSDPCAAAVKLARAVTGREKILSQGYHGTGSCYASPPQTNEPDNSRGCMQAERDAYIPLTFGDFDKLDELKNCAAVIIEVPSIIGDNPDDNWYDDHLALEFLHACASRAHKNGSLFILDEVLTGFRYAGGGASQLYSLNGEIDLYCFGKSIANGFPVSALGGKWDIVKELANGVHFSSTYFGEPLGLSAMIATLNRFKFRPPWEYIYSIGRFFAERWNSANLPWKIRGHRTRFNLRGEKGRYFDAFRDALFKKGHIFIDQPLYATTAHRDDDIEKLISDALDAIGDIK